jgi:hypothetical protein
MLRLVLEAVSLRAVEVPRRETLVRVAWKSGAVTDLHVARPSTSDIRTSEVALSRLRELAADGVRDRAIPERLNAEGFTTATGKRWNLDAVRNVRSVHRIPRTAPSLPTATPLPDRQQDGSYSVLGAARYFDVTSDVVRLWIQKGLVPATRQPGRHRGALWLHIDDEVEARLRQLANESRKRVSRRSAARSKPNTSQ